MSEQLPDTAAESTDPPAGTSRPESLDEALGAPGDLIDEITHELGSDVHDDAVSPVVLEELSGETDGPVSMHDMRMLADIDVEVTVEFGRARLALRDLLSLRRGSLVELTRGVDQPVAVLANETLVAYGEVVVVGDRFGIHVLEIVDPADRNKPLRTERAVPVWVEDRPAAAAAAPEPAADPGESDGG